MSQLITTGVENCNTCISGCIPSPTEGSGSEGQSSCIKKTRKPRAQKIKIFENPNPLIDDSVVTGPKLTNKRKRNTPENNAVEVVELPVKKPRMTKAAKPVEEISLQSLHESIKQMQFIQTEFMDEIKRELTEIRSTQLRAKHGF